MGTSEFKPHVGGIAALEDRGEASVGKLAVELLSPWIGGGVATIGLLDVADLRRDEGAIGGSDIQLLILRCSRGFS